MLMQCIQSVKERMPQYFQYLPVAFFLFSAGWLGSSLFQLGLALLIFWSLLKINDVWINLNKTLIFWLSFIAIFYISAQYLLLDSGIELSKTNKELKGYILLWLFPLVGFALYRSRMSPLWILLIAAIGLSIRIVSHTEWLDLSHFIRERHGFGMAINGIGLYSGIVVMGLLVFKHRFLFSLPKNTIWSVILWWSLILINSYCLVLALSRGAWISTIAGLITASIVWLVCTNIKTILTWRKLVMLMSMAIFFVILGTTASSKLVNRMGNNLTTYTIAMTLDREKIPYDSVGVRAHMAIYGYEKWQERFWFGWGLGSSEALLDQDDKMGRWTHFHNSYIQIATKLGVMGLFIFTVGLFLLISGLRRANKNGDLPIDMYSFLISAYVMLLIWSLFDTRIVHVDERFLLLTLTAISFRYLLPVQSEEQKRMREPDH